MFLLDTNTLTMLLYGHERVSERVSRASQTVALTIISRIEMLQGRFASVLKAEDGERLLLAQQRLADTEADLEKLPVLAFDGVSVLEFDRLRENKKLKKIGRADLLIATITLANGAVLVTRNLKDFRQVPALQVENWID